MRPFQIQPDLERAASGGFTWPLGVVPESIRGVPPQGYLITYNQAHDDEPDTYAFRVLISHEKLGPLALRAFELLPEHVGGIVEIGSRDAYRTVDTYLSADSIDRDEFISVWRHYEPLLLEDMTLAAGANAEEPYIEVFVDQFKTLSIHVPMSHRDDVEKILQEHGLEELDDIDASTLDFVEFRPILELVDEFSPDLDELLLGLRDAWQLELDVDRDRNIDEAGRELGPTLWNVVAIVYRPGTSNGEACTEETAAAPLAVVRQVPLVPAEMLEAVNGAGTDDNGENEDGAYAIFWLTARSLREAEVLVESSLMGTEWQLEEFYSTDRIAYDERPEELADLPPRTTEPVIHLVEIDPWDRTEPDAEPATDPNRAG